MKINKTYRSLLDKSIASMLSAIEIYNKPNFQYREETFAILAVNAWELLLKAIILKQNKYKLRSLYVLKPYVNKAGVKSTTKKFIDKNRSGNPKTISIIEALAILESQKYLTSNLCSNIDAIIELRDNSIHFTNIDNISRQVQELGFACIKNYISLIREKDIEIEISKYNFYLMPLAYVASNVVSESILTDETKNYLSLVKSKIVGEDSSDQNYDIAITIDIDFKKGNSFNSLGFTYDENGVKIALTEENIRQRYPWDNAELIRRCKERYSDFVQNKNWNSIRKEIKTKKKLFRERVLDPGNPKSAKKGFYSTNVFSLLDKHYTRKSSK
ncbi:MAG: DUF3644 domain-containing protein [Clostridia bacterium]|nr:DUF3644 domain-containing protein [Clostridia bacterium]